MTLELHNKKEGDFLYHHYIKSEKLEFAYLNKNPN